MKPILFFSRVFILVSVGHIHPSSHKITSLRLWYTNAIVNIHPFKRKNINPIQIHLPHIYIQAQTYTFWFSLEITDSTKSCFGAKSIYIDFLARIMFSCGISLAVIIHKIWMSTCELISRVPSLALQGTY